MRKVLEYQNSARDCRKRAAEAANNSEREALQRLAATWDMLATTRQTQIEKGLIHPTYEIAANMTERDVVRFPPSRSFAPAEGDNQAGR
jgi:hypothetical protein